MSSRTAAPPRVGAQRPTHLVTPEGRFDFSDGDDAIRLCELLGLVLLEWQRWLVRWILAVDEDGSPACSQVVIIVPRQNGKGAVLEAIELYWLLVAGVKKVIHTAHEQDTSEGHQARLAELIDDPTIEVPSTKVYKANGKERILNIDEKLLLQFRTRTKSAKRGSSPQRIVLDECQELQAAHVQALTPALAAQSMRRETKPQMIFAGSAPLEHSVYMHDFLARILERRPPKTLLAMWACDPDVDVDDVDNWYRVNPSLGELISEDFIRDTEYLVMDAPGFMAERLGVPQGGPAGAGEWVIPEAVWRAAERDQTESSIASNRQWSLAVSPDRKHAAIAVAGRRADGLVHIEFRDHRAGTGWIMDRVVQAWQTLLIPIRIHKDGPEKSYIDPLRERGVGVVDVSTAEVAAATGQLIDGVTNGTVLHVKQPELDTALSGAVLRVLGEGAVTWSQRRSTVDITTLQAATVALGGVPTVEAGGYVAIVL